MTSRVILYLSFFALFAFVAMVTMADAGDADTNTDLQNEVQRRSLTEVLLQKRAVGDEDGTPSTRRGKKRRGGRQGKKGRGKGKGKGRKKNRGPPVHESCVDPANGLSCTCDMRFEKFKDHPVMRRRFYRIC